MKHKKGRFEVIYLIPAVFIILMLFFMIVIIDIAFTNFNEACEDIGMKKYMFRNQQQLCLDYENNAHFVDMECKGFFSNKKCTATIISIGDLRTIPG